MIIKPYAGQMVTPFRPSCLDIETAPDGSVLAIGFGYEEKGKVKYSELPDWPSFITFMSKVISKTHKKSLDRLTTIYAHNGASFDWLSLIQWAHRSKLDDTMKAIIVGSKAIGIDLTISGITLKLRDSFQLIPGSLDKLSSEFNSKYKKLSIPEKYKSRMDLFQIDYPTEFSDYLRHDVLSLMELLKSFWKLIVAHAGGIGHLPMTAASLALRVWRKTLKKQIPIPQNPIFKEFERRAYSGGRTECYRACEVSVVIYDRNSMYPAEMINNLFPSHGSVVSVSSFRGKAGLYEVNYTQTDLSVKPVLRDEKSGEFRYVGSGVFCEPELTYFLKYGDIDFISGYEFSFTDYIFKEYVSEWYSVRKQAKISNNTGLSTVCKLLLNSLYGKFGQREEGEKLVVFNDSQLHEYEQKNDVLSTETHNDYILITEVSEISHVFVSIAAYVTAYARINLHKHMSMAQSQGFEIYAVDTDSIHVDSNFYMPTGSELGEWDLEYKGMAVYLGRKLYALKGNADYPPKIKAKGIGKLDRSPLEYSDYKDILTNDSSKIVDFRNFPTFRDVTIHDLNACSLQDKSRTIQPTAKDTSYNRN